MEPDEGPVRVSLRRRLLRKARSPAYAAVVTFLSLFAGLLGALYPDEVKSAFPFYWGRGPIAWHAAAFWACALGATFLFFAGQRASEERFDERTKDLERLIRSLPPSDFLFTFKDIYRRCDNAFAEVLMAPAQVRTRAVVEKAIRIILSGVATLAQKFDAEPANVTYGANVMWFRARAALDVSEAKSVNEHLIFNEPDRPISALRGVLDLDIELSTNTGIADSGPDRTLRPIALPIPEEIWSADGKRLRILPGAPVAFCFGALDGYRDTLLLGDWCREQEISETVAQRVDRYFGELRLQVRSFVSLPLQSLDDATSLVGVMNIHRNKPGLLSSKAPAEQFEPLVAPFQAMVVHLFKLV